MTSVSIDALFSDTSCLLESFLFIPSADFSDLTLTMVSDMWEASSNGEPILSSSLFLCSFICMHFNWCSSLITRFMQLFCAAITTFVISLGLNILLVAVFYIIKKPVEDKITGIIAVLPHLLNYLFSLFLCFIYLGVFKNI